MGLEPHTPTARESGLARNGFVKCDQVLTLPTIALVEHAGRLNPESIARVDDAPRFVLGL